MQQNDDEWLDKQPKEEPIDKTTVQPMNNGKPIQAGQDPMEGDDRAKCTKLVIASLCARYLPMIVVVLFGVVASIVDSEIMKVLVGLIALIAGPAYIVSWVLAILAHSADKKAVAPIILLVLYSVSLLIAVFGTIFVIHEFFSMLEDCSHMGILF